MALKYWAIQEICGRNNNSWKCYRKNNDSQKISRRNQYMVEEQDKQQFSESL